MLVKIITNQSIPGALSTIRNDGKIETVLKVSVKNIGKLIAKYRVLKITPVIHVRIFTFLKWFGSQNDYLFPSKGEKYPEQYPYPKKHLWKTRFGCKTAWELSGIIHKK